MYQNDSDIDFDSEIGTFADAQGDIPIDKLQTFVANTLGADGDDDMNVDDEIDDDSDNDQSLCSSSSSSLTEVTDLLAEMTITVETSANSNKANSADVSPNMVDGINLISVTNGETDSDNVLSIESWLCISSSI